VKSFSLIFAEMKLLFFTELLWKIWINRDPSERKSLRTQRLISLLNNLNCSTSSALILTSTTTRRMLKNLEATRKIRLN